ncbi:MULTISPECIES: bacterio-opsin activator domain-containing protein [Halobacterium]|uniref:bacterio-opsin activator domain-containing protein n=1 Tax=Halobacterium TaxID=2239 RepID=UPI00073EB94F|nr:MULTISPECIES: bacterio-opsin activator domain-containing protein [Halobacterium]MCG1003279.1 helix-turn-helix domain-containing protein [Halobacterium noricense]
MSADVAALSAASYERLRRATETHREELVVRLAGEAGLRPAEIARIRPDDVVSHDYAGVTHHFLRVRDEGDAVARDAYLPADVEHDFRQYARTVDDDERVVAVSPRRVQMLVADVGDRAADRTGDDALRDVSTRTLRQFFARQLLDEGVDPRAVAAAGGWERLASLDPFVDDADRGDVAAAFADTELAPADHSGDTAAAPETRFDAAFDRVRAVGDTHFEASTRDGVEARTCDVLVEGDAYAFAWLARYSGGTLRDETRAGAADATVDVSADAGAVGEALASGTAQVTNDVHGDAAFSVWRAAADEAGFDAVAVVPVDDRETTYGALVVGVDGRISERERALLADLGQRVGRTVTVVQQRQLLLADTVLELAFETTGEASFFAAAATEHGCTFELDGVVPGEAGTLLYFVRLSGASPDAVLSWATELPAVADGRLVRDYGDESLLELAVSGADVAKTLTDRGASVREVTATPGEQRVVVDVTTDTDVRSLVTAVTDAFPDAELVSKRERDRPDETSSAFRASLHESLTDKQASVLRAAYHAGYFEWPRGSTAEELADAIGITSPTLHNHLRRAQQKLLTAFFAEDDVGHGGVEWPDD